MAYFGDNMFGQQFDQPQWVVSVHGHSPNSVSNYDPNANFLETTCELPMTQYGTRIWTNTVPEPNT